MEENSKLNKVDNLRREVVNELRYLNSLNYLLNHPEYKYFLYDLSTGDQEILLGLIKERDINKLRWWLRQKIKGLYGQPIHIIYAIARSLGISVINKDKDQLINLILERRNIINEPH